VITKKLYIYVYVYVNVCMIMLLVTNTGMVVVGASKKVQCSAVDN